MSEPVYSRMTGAVVPEMGWVPPFRYLLRRSRILSLLRTVPRGALLEIGCGAGALLYKAWKRRPRLVPRRNGLRNARSLIMKFIPFHRHRGTLVLILSARLMYLNTSRMTEVRLNYGFGG